MVTNAPGVDPPHLPGRPTALLGQARAHAGVSPQTGEAVMGGPGILGVAEKELQRCPDISVL